MAAKTNAKRTGSAGSSPKKAAPKGGSVNKSRGNAPSKGDPPRKGSAPSKGASSSAKVAPPKTTGASTGVRIAHAEFMAGAAEQKQIPNLELTGGAPEIAFAGRSNVGKSSLLNMMLARRGLARTSNTPGCTRQINFFDVTVANARKRATPSDASNGGSEASETPDGPQKIVFVDLPGYGYAKVSKSEAASWQRLLEGYLEGRPTLRAVIVLVDIRRGLEEEERDLVEFLATRQDLPVFVAATKLDKLSLSAQKPALAALSKESGVRVVGTSAESGAGREDLWGRILYACGVQSSR